MAVLLSQIVLISEGEVKIFPIDFTGQLGADETLDAVTAAEAAIDEDHEVTGDLSLDGADVNESEVEIEKCCCLEIVAAGMAAMIPVSGALSGKVYKARITAETSEGQTLVRDCFVVCVK